VSQLASRSARLEAREPERERLEAFLEALPGGARALLIRGEPGIGKTALWRLALERCAETGVRVLLTRPAEEDMAFGLAALVDLFEHEDVDVGALLAEENPFARGRAVLTALRRIAERAPIAIAVDDLQWLDLASARALRYALRRLDREPVGLIATLRSGAEDPLAAAANLPPGRCEALEVGPLDREALRRVLAGVVEAISRPALDRIHEVSGGNPLYAIELARGLAEAGGEVPAAGLPLPDSLQGAIAQRLETVGDELAELLQVLSALGPTSVRELRDLVPDVDRLLPHAEQQGLLVVEHDLRVRFSHPLIGTVVYGRLSPLVRRSLHARLAETAVDDDVRACHLALSTEGESAPVAQLLEEAAARVRAHESYDLAADFAAHSLRLTPSDEGDAALRRALAEIEDRATAGEMSRALALADELVAALPPGPARAFALLERSYLEDDHTETGAGLLREALEHVGDDRVLRARVLEQLGWMLAMFQGRLDAGLESVREAHAIVAPTGDPLLRLHVMGSLAYLEALGGAPRPALTALAIALEGRVGKRTHWTSPRTFQAEQLLWAGDLPGAGVLFGDVHAESVRSGTTAHLPYTLFDLALVECTAGELGAAEELLREGIEAARDAEDAYGERLLLYPLALVDAWLGRADRARAAAGRRLEEARAKGERPGEVRARAVLGLLALSEGDHAAAARELGAAAELLEHMGFRHPGAFPVLPDAIEALACNGEPAGELLARLEQQARAVNSAWALAACERSRGVVALAAGDAEAAVEPLERAVAAFDELGHRPDAARAVFLDGRALLRSGRRIQAADAFADARGRFAAIGAALWEARVVEELERASPGRADGELTPAERRIAELVAEGMRNREIGQALFMSVGTVEAHLTRIYRKLGIRSRSELARLI
jgi:DNA-binding CsgD family transcriptional regulator/tetratricopeptide (TPR) repeat protein